MGKSIEEVVDFYDRICREIEIPVMIHGTADMDFTVTGALLERFPIITHIKEETSHGPKLRQYVEKLGDRVTVFAPGLHYPGELGWGALGVMPSCAAPRAHARVFDLWQEGRHDEARDEWNRMLPLVFWRWHTAAGEAGKVYLKHMGVFEHAYCRQQVTVPGKHSGAEVSFGSLNIPFDSLIPTQQNALNDRSLQTGIPVGQLPITVNRPTSAGGSDSSARMPRGRADDAASWSRASIATGSSTENVETQPW